MGRSPKKCVICHVQTDPDVLKQYGGRCKSCAMAKAATDQGMSYGKMQGMAYERQTKIAGKERLVGAYTRQEKQPVYCRKCGGHIPDGGKYDGFCCRECKAAFDKQQKNAIERGAIPDPDKETKAEPETDEIILPEKTGKNRKCLQCGAPLSGRQSKYCSQMCDYLFNREKHEQYQRDRNDAMKPEEKKRANLRCRVCNGPITDPWRRTICSEECKKKANTIYKAARRAEKNGRGKEPGHPTD